MGLCFGIFGGFLSKVIGYCQAFAVDFCDVLGDFEATLCRENLWICDGLTDCSKHFGLSMAFFSFFFLWSVLCVSLGIFWVIFVAPLVLSMVLFFFFGGGGMMFYLGLTKMGLC